MKHIHHRLSVSYISMISVVWLVAGLIAIFYTRNAIIKHSSTSMNYALEQKVYALNTAFDAITMNVSAMAKFVATTDNYDEEFYKALKQYSLSAFNDNIAVKTIYFCPNFKDTQFSKCLYLMNLVLSSTANRARVNNDIKFIDLSFDTNHKDQERKIPWFYEFKTKSFPEFPVWLSPYLSLGVEEATPMINFVYPVFSGGEFRGIVGAEVSILSIREIIDDLTFGDSFVFLVSTNGDLVYHKDFPSGLNSNYFSMDEDLTRLSEYFSDEYTTKNISLSYDWRGEKQRVIFKNLKNGMLIALSTNENALLSTQYKMIFQIAFLFVLSLVISVCIVNYLTAKIVRPIVILNESALKIAHGELNTKISVKTDDELEELASSMLKIEVELSEYISHIRDVAYMDSMTGCRNKSAYLKLVSTLESKINEGLADFAVYVFDVNGLKHINDTRGHEAGDLLIKSAAAVIKMLFSEDCIFRTGGDEFVVVIEGENSQEHTTQINLEAFKLALDDFNAESELDFKIGVSVGAAVFKNGEDLNYKSVSARADSAMYADKEAFYREHEDLRRR